MTTSRSLDRKAVRGRASGSEWKLTILPDDVLALTRPKPKGLPIGNQTSQFFVNIMLLPLNLVVAHRVQPGLAMSYVDDVVLSDDDLGKLKAARELLDGEVARLRLRFNTRKKRLGLATRPVIFSSWPGHRWAHMEAEKRHSYALLTSMQPLLFPLVRTSGAVCQATAAPQAQAGGRDQR